MIGLRDLKSFTGLTSWIAGAIPRIRWMVSILYAVCASAERDGARNRAKGSRGRAMNTRDKSFLVARKRVALPLAWLERLVSGQSNGITRRRQAWPTPGALVVLCDASQWGLGAVLYSTREQRALELFESALAKEDCACLGTLHGTGRSGSPHNSSGPEDMGGEA